MTKKELKLKIEFLEARIELLEKFVLNWQEPRMQFTNIPEALPNPYSTCEKEKKWNVTNGVDTEGNPFEYKWRDGGVINLSTNPPPLNLGNSENCVTITGNN